MYSEKNVNQRKRYNTDPKFRAYMIKASTKYQHENREKINAKLRKVYANRSPEEIKKRKNYLKKLRPRRYVQL